MSETQPVLVRQWRLLRLLSARPEGVALRELASAVEVSQKTVRRDLDLFQRVGLEKMRGLFVETAFGVTDYGPHAEILDRLLIAIEEHRVAFIA